MRADAMPIPPSTTQQEPTTPRWRARHRWALALVLAVAAALRVAYGWPDPSAGRNYDARFALPNIESNLRQGGFAPVNAYHPSLSYLPQTLALAAVEACGCLELGTGTRSVLRPHGKHPPGARAREGGPALAAISPLGYRSCRLVQSLLGTIALGLLALLAARVLGPWPGVAAAAIGAFVPWHLWTAGLCNEEAGLCLAVVVAGLATLAAERRGDWTGYALAGVAFGATLAAKLNGGPVALPLAVWSLARARREPRRLALLTGAAVVAAATFLALNPHFVTRFDLVRRDFGFTVGHYARKAIVAETGRLEVVRSGLTSPAAPEFLGLPLALLAGLGLALAARRGTDPRRTTDLRLIALFPLTYVPTLALVTPHIKDHNWLPVLPFAIVLALAGAGALIAAARRAGGRALAALALAAVAAATLPVVVRGWTFVYQAVVPDTLEVALRQLGPTARKGRAILIRDVAGDRRWVGRRVGRRHLFEIELPADDLGLDAARLAGADHWVLRRESAARMAPEVTPAFEVPSRWFRTRGPALLVGGAPWRAVGRREAAVADARWGPEASLAVSWGPPPPRAARFSLRFGVISARRSSTCTVELDGTTHPAHLELRRRAAPGAPLGRVVSRARAAELFFTERLEVGAGVAAVVRCTGPGALRIAEPVELLYWAPGRAPVPASQRPPQSIRKP